MCESLQSVPDDLWEGLHDICISGKLGDQWVAGWRRLKQCSRWLLGRRGHVPKTRDHKVSVKIKIIHQCPLQPESQAQVHLGIVREKALSKNAGNGAAEKQGYRRPEVSHRAYQWPNIIHQMQEQQLSLRLGHQKSVWGRNAAAEIWGKDRIRERKVLPIRTINYPGKDDTGKQTQRTRSAKD